MKVGKLFNFKQPTPRLCLLHHAIIRAEITQNTGATRILRNPMHYVNNVYPLGWSEKNFFWKFKKV